MSADGIIREMKEKMKKSIEFIHHEFSGIRTGKASPSLVEGILVDYYGSLTRLKELAGISTPEPRLIVVQPWDPQALPNVEKAIRQSDLGINPMTDGKVIRLPVPELSEERRKDLIKLVKKKAEEGKVAIRNERRLAIEGIKKAEKNKEISEDEKFLYEEEIQKDTDHFILEIDKILEHKEREIMAV